MANLLGDDFKLYHDTATTDITTTWPTATWVEQKDVGDLGMDRAPTSVNIPRRGTKDKVYKRGQFDRRLTFSLNYDPADAFVTAIEAAIEAGSGIHLAIADGDISTSGTIYYHANWVVVGDPLSAALDSGAAFEVELAPHADSFDEPAKATVP